MDRTALILAALAARAGDTAPEVRDAQAALMAQLRMRFAGRANGEAALASYEESAPGWEAALGAELAAAGADGDEGPLVADRDERRGCARLAGGQVHHLASDIPAGTPVPGWHRDPVQVVG